MSGTDASTRNSAARSAGEPQRSGPCNAATTRTNSRQHPEQLPSPRAASATGSRAADRTFRSADGAVGRARTSYRGTGLWASAAVPDPNVDTVVNGLCGTGGSPAATQAARSADVKNAGVGSTVVTRRPDPSGATQVWTVAARWCSNTLRRATPNSHRRSSGAGGSSARRSPATVNTAATTTSAENSSATRRRT